MKKTTLALSLLFALGFANPSQAEIKLTLKNNGESCEITNGKVVQKLDWQNTKLGYTIEKTISFYGVEELAKKAVEASSVAPASANNLDIQYSVVLDGTTTPIHFDDSEASQKLIFFIGKVCK
jgi:hypothetical protein